MTHLSHNRNAWNQPKGEYSRWTVPVDSDTISRARAGDWSLLLTPSLPVPAAWFGEVSGLRILCLASGGGQQAPVLAAAGAEVVSFDLSDRQLEQDRIVAERDGLSLVCKQGDMADLSRFADAAFDLIFHPVSNVFVPDLAPVWRECFRVLAPGGRLLAGVMNPALFMFDHDEGDVTGRLEIKYALPYTDTESLTPEALAARKADLEPLEFSHSLDTQLGGQLAAGFLLAGFYEDAWHDETWVFSRYCPVSFATLAMKPVDAG